MKSRPFANNLPPTVQRPAFAVRSDSVALGVSFTKYLFLKLNAFVMA